MKKIALALATAAIAACGAAKTNIVSSAKDIQTEASALSIYDEAADEFLQVLKITPDVNGYRSFKTADSSLEISCIQGLRPSCTFSGLVSESSITINDDAAEQFAGVIAFAPDLGRGYQLFETRDGKLSVTCVQGLRYSCSLTVK